MPVPLLNEANNELGKEIDKSFELLQTVNQLSHLQIDQVHLIYELSFLKIFLAWEFYLEKSFILYMLGEETESGYKPRAYVIPRDEKHAYELIKGGRSFPDWLNLEFIREKSELFFENGSPFKDVLYNNQTIKEGLQMMKIIRNRIVHISQKTQQEFSNLLRNEFGHDSGIGPGEFLKKNEAKRQKSLSYIDYFKDILLTAANNIVR
jgi:hypothetical protein